MGERALLARAGLDPDGGRAAVDDLLERAAGGDPAAVAALAGEARWLAIGIAGLVNVLDPDTVVLGGLFARILPLIRASLDDELAARRHPSTRDVGWWSAQRWVRVRSPSVPPSWPSALCSGIRPGR